MELHIQRPSLFVADGILTGASIGAMLLTVRKVNLALALRPPMGVLGFAAGALALGVVSLLLKASPMASSYLLGHDFPLWGQLNAVKHLLDILVHLLLAGALGVTRAGLRRAGAPADGGSDWTAATDSLGLFNRGVFAHLAVCLLATAALPIHSGMDVEMDMREAAQRGIMLVGLVFGVMMLVGLLRYASVPGLAGARAYVYAALVLFLNAESSSQAARMPWIAVAVLPACFLLLSGSFRQVARMLEEPELAEDALLVALWLFVPGCVAFVLGFFDDLGAFRHFVLFVAVVCVLIGVVRFFLLMGRLRRRMSGRELERKRVGSYADLPHGLS